MKKVETLERFPRAILRRAELNWSCDLAPSLSSLGSLEMVWPLSGKRKDLNFFQNYRDDPSPRKGFLFHRPHKSKEFRSAQRYFGCDVLSPTASLGLDGVARLDHLHGRVVLYSKT